MVTWLEKRTDVLVIGGGAAGLMAALKAARSGARVLVVTDGAYASTGILGFNALVSEEDSPELFFDDIYRGGACVNDPELIRAFVSGTARAVKDLEKIGLAFDKNQNGSYHLLQPLGCSVPRLVHSGNKTGKISMDRMYEQLRKWDVELWDHSVACGIRMAGRRAAGAFVYRWLSREAWKIRAGAVVIATGGGHMLKGSTYPACQTGDGFAMGFRAGAGLRDMEFFQHEPCRAIWPKPLGISTTLLAKGGKLTNALGERFVLKTHPSEGAASKDELARLVAQEIRAGRGTPHGGVWLDLTDLPEKEIRVNHALYDQRFREVGIDLCADRVEVGPAAHSIMGGLVVDQHCATAVEGLFAAGEAMGGLHGANRLGGNAGAEVYVFGSIAGLSAADFARRAADHPEGAEELNWNIDDGLPAGGIYDTMAGQIREALSRAMGPIRDAQTLTRTLDALDAFQERLEPERAMCWEDRIACFKAENLLTVGRIMVNSALTRRESRGVHFREDYPERDDRNWKRSILTAAETVG